MYSFKEKKRHFVDLKNAAAAESDLLLLMSKVKQVSPSWRRQPRRYADDILYRLLDVATREEIRIHRRERMKVQDGMSSTGDESKAPLENSVPTEGTEIDVDDIQNRISEAEAAKKEAEGRTEEAEAALEEAEGRAEEAEAALEEADGRAEEAEAALEEEKKKEPKQVKPTPKVAKSKSTKSTHK